VDIPLEHPLVQHLWPIGAKAGPVARVEATLRAYEAGTRLKLSTPITDDERAAVRLWLVAAEMYDAIDDTGHGMALLATREGPLIHPGVSEKIGYLQQASCSTCLLDESRSPIAISFGVRTRPFSAQSLGADELRVLKERIADRMAGKFSTIDDWQGAELCVTVVCALGAGDRQKDADNMVKGLLDALQGSVYANDTSIAHLSVIRIRQEGNEGFYALGASPALKPLDDVIQRTLTTSWPAQDEITI
jgi:Endodeoxyribonuclease RusA